MRFTKMHTRQRSVSSFFRFSTPVLAGTLGLALALGACAPSETTDSAIGETMGEKVASDVVKSTSVESAASIETRAATKVYTEDGVAIGGADPVAYFSSASEGDFVAGSPDYTHNWNGVTWQFASAENRDEFAANPEQYAPQYGGHCAWAAAQNAIAAIDPSAWEIVDGKLYLNLNQKIQTRWQKDIPGNIAKADTNWPALSVQ